MSSNSRNDFRKPRLPGKNSGRFVGERGNSAFIPKNDQAQKKLAEFGTDRVNYVNGYPDFSPFSTIQDEKLGTVDGQVQIGHMTTNRQNGSYEYGRRSDSHAETEDPGNFAQADNELARKLNAQNHSSLTGADIQEMRERNHLTWHEVEDAASMQLVPQDIHEACPHSGGVATRKDLDRIANEEDYDFWDPSIPNAMDYTYNEDTGELVPINHEESAETAQNHDAGSTDRSDSAEEDKKAGNASPKKEEPSGAKPEPDKNSKSDKQEEEPGRTKPEPDKNSKSDKQKEEPGRTKPEPHKNSKSDKQEEEPGRTKPEPDKNSKSDKQKEEPGGTKPDSRDSDPSKAKGNGTKPGSTRSEQPQNTQPAEGTQRSSQPETPQPEPKKETNTGSSGSSKSRDDGMSL